MKRLKTVKNKKGFTLIEIIVVLIILAIMAAIAVPSMIGFVDDSKNQALLSEARVGLLAAQTIATKKEYALVKSAEITETTHAFHKDNLKYLATPTSEFQKLVKGITGDFLNVETDANWNVIKISYEKSGRGVKYENGTWTTYKP